jgi:hypothetical protein
MPNSPTQKSRPARTPHPITAAELARRAGVNRSSITRALRRELAPARMHDRVDVAHTVVVRWAISRGLDPIVLLDIGSRERSRRPVLLVEETAPSVGDFARSVGAHPTDVMAEVSDALVPPGHISVTEFAWRAGVRPSEVIAAVDRGELQPAVLKNGRLDLGHPAALEFMAAHPYKTDRRGNLIGGDGHLAGAMVGEQINVDHPFARAVIARSLGRVATEADFEAAQGAAE